MRWHLLVPIILLTGTSPVVPSAFKGCDGGQKPFLVPPATVRTQLQTIAVMEVTSERAMSPGAEARMSVLDSMLAGALRGGGFELVAGSVIDSTWRAVRELGGPIFDPYTGQEDTSVMNAARQELRRVLQESIHVNAVLYPSLVVVEANVASLTQIEWDGVSQGYLSFGAAMVDAMTNLAYSGPTEALSLSVYIEDVDGQGLYDSRGGLQVLAIPKHGQLVAVPDSKLLTDRKRMKESVRIALCPLLKRAAH